MKYPLAIQLEKVLYVNLLKKAEWETLLLMF
jgi:hypothetical protein